MPEWVLLLLPLGYHLLASFIDRVIHSQGVSGSSTISLCLILFMSLIFETYSKDTTLLFRFMLNFILKLFQHICSAVKLSQCPLTFFSPNIFYFLFLPLTHKSFDDQQRKINKNNGLSD